MLPFDQSPICLRVAHAMEAIVIDGVPIVDKQFAAIIRLDREAINAWTIDDQKARPTHSKVVTLAQAWPCTSGRSVVHNGDTPDHVRAAAT